MATTLDSYASDFVGESTIPRPRSVFTPAAYANATSIADRARLAMRNLGTSLKLADAESKTRQYILDGQMQDSKAAELAREAELQAMQPALLQDLGKIDPADDDAYDKLTELEGYVTSPQIRRKASSLRAAAGIIRRDKVGLIEQMQQGGYGQQDIEQMLEGADQQFRSGDHLAFTKAATGLKTWNQRSAEDAAAMRPMKAAEEDFKRAQENLRTETLTDDSEKAKSSIRATLDAVKKKIPTFDTEAFLADPDAAMLSLPDDPPKATVDALHGVKKRAAALAQYEAAKKTHYALKARAVLNAQPASPQKPVAGQTMNGYVYDVLSQLK